MSGEHATTGRELDEIARIDTSPLSAAAREALQVVFERCIKCNTCKASFGQLADRHDGFRLSVPSCPSGERHRWESYWASGRIRIARGLLLGEIALTPDVLDPIFACPTCGHCMDNCQAPHKDQIVDVIEALRELAVREIGAPGPQRALATRIGECYNPYGEPHAGNAALKEKHGLPDTADVVYFIGCTSKYRQQRLRDATISVLKKLGIDFTIVDEHCCGSPLIRTGQVEEVPRLVAHNLDAFKQAGASTVVTSCAGCYRTMRTDFTRHGDTAGTGLPRVVHVSEFILPRLSPDLLKGTMAATLTYHDPCHLGHHSGLYDAPRNILKMLRGTELREMVRNRNHSWCCGAGGGVKIGYPEWALDISTERVKEAIETGASVLVSTCPFCKTNLNDAAEALGTGTRVADLVEVLDELL